MTIQYDSPVLVNSGTHKMLKVTLTSGTVRRLFFDVSESDSVCQTDAEAITAEEGWI